jgi:hypothetical protein
MMAAAKVRKEIRMRPIARCSTMVVGATLLAGAAMAQDGGTGTEGLGSRSPSGGGAATSSPGNTGAGATTGATSSGCSHQMTGTVKRIDKATGTVSIDVAGAGDLQFTLPPSELSGFETGDQVVVSMGMRESRDVRR